MLDTAVRSRQLKRGRAEQGIPVLMSVARREIATVLSCAALCSLQHEKCKFRASMRINIQMEEAYQLVQFQPSPEHVDEAQS